MILLQARTSSNRLPAKSLLHVAGMPAVVLAARRAGNTGREVVVATSNDPSDDLLVSVLRNYQIPFFRGDLSNVLRRFVGATSNLEDDEIVVRLTADNLFPDGWFIDQMIEMFRNGRLNYLGSGSPECGLPYGMSAEITRAGLLREALASCHSPEDLEHVTPYIRRRYGEQGFLGLADIGLSNYRCTIDTLDDYLNVAKIFQMTNDPVRVSCRQLLDLIVEAC